MAEKLVESIEELSEAIREIDNFELPAPLSRLTEPFNNHDSFLVARRVLELTLCHQLSFQATEYPAIDYSGEDRRYFSAYIDGLRSKYDLSPKLWTKDRQHCHECSIASCAFRHK